jgi:Fur family ferric uptake transcriptional regulator
MTMPSWSYPAPTDLHPPDDPDGEPPEALLRRLGLTPTRGRLAILEQLTPDQPLTSTRDLHQRLAQLGCPVGLATVYRTLRALADAGILHTFIVGSEVTYHRCGPQHHHHIVCIRCGHVWEEHPPAVEHWVSQAVETSHARLVEHRADIFVICHTCDAPR